MESSLLNRHACLEQGFCIVANNFLLVSYTHTYITHTRTRTPYTNPVGIRLEDTCVQVRTHTDANTHTRAWLKIHTHTRAYRIQTMPIWSLQTHINMVACKCTHTHARTHTHTHTVRLWSLQTHTNMVAYKGHNHAVWDVDFSPIGFYFASASHDNTARVWSTDCIY
eukprot:Colp12_sorted_trinity150504_noHs@22932